jgi:hypothetical protein
MLMRSRAECKHPNVVLRVHFQTSLKALLVQMPEISKWTIITVVITWQSPSGISVASIGQGQGKEKTGARFCAGGEIDFTAVFMQDFLADIEAQAGPTLLAGGT